MKNLYRKRIRGLLLVGAMLMLVGCSKKQEVLEMSSDFKGETIGVLIGYSPDYILTKEFKEIDLRRYDTFGDMQLACHFGSIDAMAIESDEAKVFERLYPDYTTLATIREDEEFGYQFSAKREDLVKMFNEFIAQFKTTEEYADICRRVGEVNEHPYEAKEVELTASADAPVIYIGVNDGWEPVSYLNTENNQIEGADVELMKHFANSVGMRIEIQVKEWNQAIIELGTGQIDIFSSPDSLYMKEDYENSGRVLMTDAVWQKDILLVGEK